MMLYKYLIFSAAKLRFRRRLYENPQGTPEEGNGCQQGPTGSQRDMKGSQTEAKWEPKGPKWHRFVSFGVFSGGETAALLHRKPKVRKTIKQLNSLILR